jgi:hypothetical protein
MRRERVRRVLSYVLTGTDRTENVMQTVERSSQSHNSIATCHKSVMVCSRAGWHEYDFRSTVCLTMQYSFVKPSMEFIIMRCLDPG